MAGWAAAGGGDCYVPLSTFSSPACQPSPHLSSPGPAWLPSSSSGSSSLVSALLLLVVSPCFLLALPGGSSPISSSSTLANFSSIILSHQPLPSPLEGHQRKPHLLDLSLNILPLLRPLPTNTTGCSQCQGKIRISSFSIFYLLPSSLALSLCYFYAD